MEKSNLYILTEGGDGIGLGHIIRCSALYEKALDYDLEPKFIVFGKNIDKTLKKYNYEIREWKDVAYLSAFLTKDDYVIIDSYLASIEIYKLISKLVKKVIYIDDNMRLNYSKGIVVNPSLYGDELNYPKNEDISYLLGKDYIILRKEFEENKKIEKNQQKKIEKILITLGGTDIRNLTPKLLKMLKNINENFKIKVVVGNNYSNIREILEEKTSNIKLLYDLEALQMKKEMEESDLIISACGQTVYELLVIGADFIPLVVADNQMNNAKKLLKDKISKAINKWDEFKEINLVEQIKFIEEKNKKNKSFEIGTNKIVEYLLNEYWIREIKKQDCKKIFELSNDEYIRKMSINKEQIEYENHQKWFKNTLKNKKIKFYVLENFKKQILGQVRFNIENNEALISISLAKELRGKNQGKLILKNSLKKFLEENFEINKIIAYIRSENKASIKIFESNGFLLKKIEKNLIKYEYFI